MKLTLSNPAMFLFSAKNSAGDSANRKNKKSFLDIHTHTHTHTHTHIYIYIYIERERERERLTLLENAFLSFSWGFRFAFLRLRWALAATSGGLHGNAAKNFSSESFETKK